MSRPAAFEYDLSVCEWVQNKELEYECRLPLYSVKSTSTAHRFNLVLGLFHCDWNPQDTTVEGWVSAALPIVQRLVTNHKFWTFAIRWIYLILLFAAMDDAHLSTVVVEQIKKNFTQVKQFCHSLHVTATLLHRPDLLAQYYSQACFPISAVYDYNRHGSWFRSRANACLIMEWAIARHTSTGRTLSAAEIYTRVREVHLDEGPLALTSPNSTEEEEIERILQNDANDHPDILSYACAVLGVGSDIDLQTAERAFRELSKAFHPDKCSHASASDVFNKLNEAIAIIRNPLTVHGDNESTEDEEDEGDEDYDPGEEAEDSAGDNESSAGAHRPAPKRRKRTTAEDMIKGIGGERLNAQGRMEYWVIWKEGDFRAESSDTWYPYHTVKDSAAFEDYMCRKFVVFDYFAQYWAWNNSPVSVKVEPECE
jgi:hypothetical protein